MMNKFPTLFSFLFFFLSTTNTYAFTEEKFEPGSINGTFYQRQIDNKNIDSDGFKIQRIDPRTSIRQDDFNTLNDKSIFSFNFLTNADLASFGSILGLTGTYSSRNNVGWYEFMVGRHNANFEEVAANNAAATEEPDGDDIESSQLTITTIGFGWGYRSNNIQNFLKSDAYFEHYKALVVYDFVNSDLFTESFRGFGIQAEYGIYKRTSESFQYGLNASYHGSIIKRQSFGDEASSARSLILSWMSLGLVASFYY